MQHIKGTSLGWLLLVVFSTLDPLVKADSSPSVCLSSNIGSSQDRLQVDCQHKNLTSVPTGLSKQTELLKLNGNKLTALPTEAFSSIGLVNLKNLRLRFNAIVIVHKNAFKNLNKLQVLMLDYNQIPSLHAETFRDNSELEIISLSHNPITRLEDGLFTNMSQLASVEVEFCELSYISPKAFDNVPNLYYLYLNGNKLVQVDFAALLPLRSLRMILDKNPWKCDCKLKSLRDWMVKGVLESSIEWYKDHSPSCAAPALLANKTWLETKSEDFVC